MHPNCLRRKLLGNALADACCCWHGAHLACETLRARTVDATAARAVIARSARCNENEIQFDTI
eukprot:4794027-Lingulodinium_polyedra.AAC.1